MNIIPTPTMTAAATPIEELKEDQSSRIGDSCDTHQDGSSSAQIQFAVKEDRQLRWMRPLLFLILLATAAAMSFIFYWNARKAEKEEFETTYDDVGHKLITEFEANARRRVAAIESLAVAISSSAKAQGQAWPNVTLSDFERRVSYVLDQAQVVSIIFLPFVTGEMKQGWEAYSVHNQEWLQQGLDLQADVAKYQVDELSSIEILEATWGTSQDGLTIPEQINCVSGTGLEPETGAGPYAVWWQFAPVFPIPNLVNYNTLSHPTRSHQIKAVMETHNIVLSEAWDYSDTKNPGTVGKKAALNLFLNRRQDIGISYQDGPVSDLYIPIFGDYNQPDSVVGALTAYLYWQAYFLHILPPGSNKVVVVLSNTCGQTYTYDIDGPEARYVGPGDLHNTKYDYLKMSTGFNVDDLNSGRNLNAVTETQTTAASQPPDVDPMLDIDSSNHEDVSLTSSDGRCVYKIEVFPSSEMEDDFSTNQPWVITAIILLAFLLTSGIFLVYDCLVQRRQQIVMNEAVKSTKVVHSLFPEAVRERMQASECHSPGEEENQQNVVADLYPEATVLFADLRGFTQWSDGREPKDVFLLLQTLYGAFDEVARIRRVFKIETIGDCYVAVCGVPKAQKQHALIMSRFARDIMEKMHQLIDEKLVEQLGPETQELELRVGLHSGAVTAGVLRGERARFQLFGDTVNTASRMESLGVPGKIQASEATARLLIEAGKLGWCCEREGGVEAKGKGHMRTFFISPTSMGGSSVTGSSHVITDHSDSDSATGSNSDLHC